MWKFNEHQFTWELWTESAEPNKRVGWIAVEFLYPLSTSLALAVRDKFGSVPPPLEPFLLLTPWLYQANWVDFCD